MTRYQQVINILDQAIGGPGMNSLCMARSGATSPGISL